MFLGIQEAFVEANLTLHTFVEDFAELKVHIDDTTQAINAIATDILAHDLTKYTASNIMLKMDCLEAKQSIAKVVGAIKFIATIKLML